MNLDSPSFQSKNVKPREEANHNEQPKLTNQFSASLLATPQRGCEKPLCVRFFFDNNDGTKKGSKRTWKKPAGKPKRPLSAYNYFFQHHRSVIVSSLPGKRDLDVALDNAEAGLSAAHGKRKRPRRSEGIGVGFADLARNVAQAWKSLGPEARKLYDEQARADKERYETELEVWSVALSAQQEADSAEPKTVSYGVNDNSLIRRERLPACRHGCHNSSTERCWLSNRSDHSSNGCHTFRAPPQHLQRQQVSERHHGVAVLQPLALWAIRQCRSKPSDDPPPQCQQHQKQSFVYTPSKHDCQEENKATSLLSVSTAVASHQQQQLAETYEKSSIRNSQHFSPLKEDLSMWADTFFAPHRRNLSPEPPSNGATIRTGEQSQFQEEERCQTDTLSNPFYVATTPDAPSTDDGGTGDCIKVQEKRESQPKSKSNTGDRKTFLSLLPPTWTF